MTLDLPALLGCLRSSTASLTQEEHRGIIHSIDEGVADLYRYESVPLPAPMHRAAGQEDVHIR